jgi:hypothetical protein
MCSLILEFFSHARLSEHHSQLKPVLDAEFTLHPCPLSTHLPHLSVSEKFRTMCLQHEAMLMQGIVLVTMSVVAKFIVLFIKTNLHSNTVIVFTECSL